MRTVGRGVLLRAALRLVETLHGWTPIVVLLVAHAFQPVNRVLL